MAPDLETLLLGGTCACAAFTCMKASKQTYMCWHRSGRINVYIVMVWLEWSSCIAVSLMSWMYLEKRTPPSFGYYFGMLCMWTINVQCITQIVINRVSLIMFNPARAVRLKWMVAVFIGVINVSLFCTWIPGHMNANPGIERANFIWDRAEKVFFLVLELSLNSYFMWLVRSELIASGLTKYNTLFKFNVAMVTISVSLDAVIIGVMSLPNDLEYIQFHALFFLIKLHIEMKIAELLAQIAKSTGASGSQPSVESRPTRRTSRTQSDPRFPSCVTWEQCFGLDSPKRTIGQALGRDEDDKQQDVADLERLAETRAPSTSRVESRRTSQRLDRLDSTASTEVDWSPIGAALGGMEKDWTAERGESGGRGRSDSDAHGLGSRRRHHSV